MQIRSFHFVCYRPELEDLSSEDEAVATDLDMHALILSSSTDTHSPEEPLKTAEEVLREIDDIMQVNIQFLQEVNSQGKREKHLFCVGKSVDGKISGFRWVFIG